MTSCDKAENSSLCARGCGFYGNPSNYNICSQFYKAFLKEESAKSAIALSEKLSFLTVDDTVKTKNDDGLTMKTKTQRCKSCKKKVGLVGFSYFLKEESAKSAIALSEKLYFLTVNDTVKTGNDDGLTMKTKTERCKSCKKKVGLVGFSSFLKEESAKIAIALSEKLYFLTVDDTVKTENDDGLTMKTKTERCNSCKKKVGLVGFSCKCGGIFCRIHWFPEELACTINFKSLGRALLVKENPLCKADKLEYRI
ncbi:zinc finger A20 and AN1 domain-containing stress-associated protein 9-like [Nicotiana tomentosiformis]|uniref:zinc finger A20 and AN1 domain-containing stress-associated protein 9-like n=1 Tax=Nicotiana tomentosiformis TaxID=4098 RepID=UPI00388C387C